MLEQPYTGVVVASIINGVMGTVDVGGISVSFAHALRIKMLPRESNKINRIRFIY
jgi:hypothetical protein